jgi:hypothetical protein
MTNNIHLHKLLEDLMLCKTNKHHHYIESFILLLVLDLIQLIIIQLQQHFTIKHIKILIQQHLLSLTHFYQQMLNGMVFKFIKQQLLITFLLLLQHIIIILI